MESYRLRVSRSVIGLIRTMQDTSAAVALTDAINALHEEPVPSEAEQVLDGIQLYVLLVGDYRVVYNVDQNEQIVNVSEVQRWPDA